MISAVLVAAAGSLFAAWQAGQAQPVSSPIETILQSGANPATLGQLRRFYGARSNTPAWFDVRGLNAEGRAAVDVLSHAADEGLDPARYDLAGLVRPLSSPDSMPSRDIALTAAVLRYASEMLDGRPDLKSLDRDIDLPGSGVDVAVAAERAVETHHVADFLAGLEPHTPDYAPLKAALARYRAMAAKGGWPTLPARKAYTADNADPLTLETLNGRLSAEDPALAQAASVADVDAAIRRFQARNGLEADGSVGPSTIADLNVSASDRAATLAANLERLRWLPHVLEPSYVAVNVPDASLAVVDKGQTVLRSRVIVGRPGNRTPIFRAMITGIVVNPPWNVPAAIARHEIAPKAAANPSYLARNHIVERNGEFQQLPGDDNALGQIKLDVSDRFVVYLHDTPARSLFARSNRFLSHGCIRVQQIKPLASFALTGDIAAGLDRLETMIADGATQHVPIRAPVPVYVVYLTAFEGPEGVNFRHDIYGRDGRLIAAMGGRTSFAQAAPASVGCRHNA